MPDRTHSLEIPLNISWGINLHILDIRPFVLVAPTFTYAFNKMAVLSLDNNSTGLSIPTFKQTAWGIALGAGLDIWKLQVMLKWKWGISDILPDIPTDVNDAYKLLNNNKDFGSKLKENTFSISLGYIF